MTDHFLKRIIAPTIPYFTIGLGLFVFHNAWAAIFSYHLGMIAIIVLSRQIIPVKEIFQSTRYIIPVFTAVAGASGGLLLYLLWPLLSVPAGINLYLQNIGLSEETWPLFLVYFILVNPCIEEYYWRGYLGNDSKHIVLNDLFFSGYHVMVMAGKVQFIWLVVVFMVLFSGAWCWRQSNRMSQGLLPSVASHIAADITVIFTIYWMTMR